MLYRIELEMEEQRLERENTYAYVLSRCVRRDGVGGQWTQSKPAHVIHEV